MVAAITNLADYRTRREANEEYRQALADAAPALRRLQVTYTAAQGERARDSFGLVLVMLANTAERAGGNRNGAA